MNQAQPRQRPILLLVNPVSGGKPGAPAVLDAPPEALEPEALLAAFLARGLDTRLHVLTEGDDPAQLAAHAAVEGQDVVVAGGDGTVGPVAAVLCGTEAALGILAMGSWNNVAYGAGVPLQLGAVLDAIAQGHVQFIDAGLAWHIPAGDGTADEELEPPPDADRFFEAAGVGLDAVWFGTAEAGERRGLAAALRSGWRALRRRRTWLRLVVDGRPLRTRAPAVTVCNAPFMGMGFAVAPDADPADGFLNVVVFSGMTRWDVLRHLLAVARRRPRREPRMTRLTARRVAIHGVRRVVPVHADGRSIGTTPVAFAVDPGALRVFR